MDKSLVEDRARPPSLLLLLIVFSVYFDIGARVWLSNTLATAVREGSRYGRRARRAQRFTHRGRGPRPIRPPDRDTAIPPGLRNYAAGVPNNLTVQSTWPDGNAKPRQPDRRQRELFPVHFRILSQVFSERPRHHPRSELDAGDRAMTRCRATRAGRVALTSSRKALGRTAAGHRLALDTGQLFVARRAAQTPPTRGAWAGAEISTRGRQRAQARPPRRRRHAQRLHRGGYVTVTNKRPPTGDRDVRR